jgi:hypothetical protein
MPRPALFERAMTASRADTGNEARRCGRREMTFKTEMTLQELKQADAYYLQGHALLIEGDEGAYFTYDEATNCRRHPENPDTHVWRLNKTIPITDAHREMLPKLNKLT